MRPLGPCSRCGAPGVRSLGVDDLCGSHLAELLSTFAPSVWAFNGLGLPAGRQRPDLGPSVEELRCIACGATWCGLAGDRCAFCRRSAEHLAAHTRAMLLAVPEVADGANADDVLRAWGARLRRGVDAGVVTRDEAERTWKRAVSHARVA